jgi:NADPH2:quinone reductase
MTAAVKRGTRVVLERVPVPRPGPHDVLMRVRANSLNRADLYLAEGRAHGAHGGDGTVLGLEWAGDVVAVGDEVQGFRVGDRAMCGGIGGFADFAVADGRRCLPLPSADMDYDTAACLPIALRTAHVSLADLGQLKPGQSVLVLGASSAVGLMCLQMARELGAGLVIGTSTTARRRAQLGGHGAHVALDSTRPEWVQEAVERTGGRGVDLLIDFLAGPHLNDAMRATAIAGRIVNVGRMAGEQGHFDFDLHSMRRIHYVGQTFRTRSADEIARITRAMQADLWPALSAGRLRLPIDRRFPLSELPQAFEAMRGNRHFGKIVIYH